MTKLVGDDRLQLIASEQINTPPRHPQHRVVDRKTDHKRIDAGLLLQHIHARRGHPRSNGHFLHDVEKPSPGRIPRRPAQFRASQPHGNRLNPTGQTPPLGRNLKQEKTERGRTCDNCDPPGVPPVDSLVSVDALSRDRPASEGKQEGDARCSQNQKKADYGQIDPKQAGGPTVGDLLTLEKIHAHRQFPQSYLLMRAYRIRRESDHRL